MGLLTVKPDKSQLHLIHCLSDASMFYNYEVLFLCEIDSYRKNVHRTIAQAAFVVRFVNLTLKTSTFCLPVFWVNDKWEGECYVVYEHKNTVIFFKKTQSRD